MRPLLVLLVVLAAIGALLFAVLNLGHAPAPAPVEVTTNTPVSTTAGAPPTDLTPTPQDRRTQPKPAEGGPKVSRSNDMQFDNKVTGLVKNQLGAPVVGAEVTLSTFGTEAIPFTNNPRPDPATEPKVRTDAEGRYAFLGMEPRVYSIIVTHAQYAMHKELTMPVGESGVFEQAPVILSPGATLSGYVKDEAGNLINEATLDLEGEQFLATNEPSPDRLTTHTNNEGWYSFVNVAPGSRSVAISAPGYGKIQVGGLVFQKDAQYARDFTLKIAQMICGRVVTGGNEGVPNATVIALAVSNTQQTGRDQIVTDQKGEFCFEKLVPGDYNLIASAKGWRTLPGRVNRVSTNTSNWVIEMIKEASVCGTVIDAATGKPVPDFTVRMRFWFTEGQPTAPVGEEVLSVSNAQGEFCIEGVPASEGYVVEAAAPGYSPSFSSNFSVQMGKSVKDVVVRLGRGGSITGRVVDGEGKPIARARIVTHDNDWTDDAFTEALGIQMPTNATKVDVRTDDAGQFTCTGLTPDNYLLVVSANGYASITHKGVRVGEGVSVPAGDIRLGRGGTLKGTLFDESGKPIAGGTIQLRSLVNAVPQSSTKSDADGKFVFQNRLPGRYQLSGMRPAGTMNPFEELAQNNASKVDVVLGEGESTTQDLRLQP